MAAELLPPPAGNPLISPNPSTSGLRIALHPLALLSISDYVTRHTLRQNTGPIVGALLGTQQGRDISIEQAFEVKVLSGNDQRVGLDGGEEEIVLDLEWFNKRLRLFKDTHPTMDLLGWYSTTTSPNFHPSFKHVHTHRSLQVHNESLILLLLNPYSASVGGKLPLGVFESFIEGGDAQAHQAGGSEGGILKFVPAEYTVETGEAEMIGVGFVAKGGWGNAAAVASGPVTEVGKSGSSLLQSSSQGISVGGDTVLSDADVSAVKDEKSESVSVASFTGAQNDELLANLTAKANAIRMLHSRIVLLKKYLESLPQMQDPGNPTPEVLPVSHPLLREIKSLTHSRLPLLIPADEKAFEQEALAEQSDVALVALLGTLTRSVEEMKEVQRIFGVVDSANQREGGQRGDREGGGREVGEGRSSQRGKESGSGGGLSGGFMEKYDLGRLMRTATGAR